MVFFEFLLENILQILKQLFQIEITPYLFNYFLKYFILFLQKALYKHCIFPLEFVIILLPL